MCVFGSTPLQETEILQPREDLLARGKTVDAVKSSSKLAEPSGSPRK